MSAAVCSGAWGAVGGMTGMSAVGHHLLTDINSIKKTSVYDIPYFVSSNKHVSNTYRWKPKKNLITIAKDIQDWQINNFRLLKNI